MTNEELMAKGAALPPLISVQQACILLGVARTTGYRAAANGDIPVLRWGRRVLVPTGRLIALVVGEEEKAG